MNLFFILAALLIGYWIGWANAHHTVATECDRLGSFFVGKKVYTCMQVKESEE